MNPLTFLSLIRSPLFMKLLGLMGDWKSMSRLYFLHAAIESGLLTALDKPKSRAELISVLGVEHAEYLDGLLDVGQAIGELGRQGDNYVIKGKRSRNIRDDKEEALAAFVQANVTYYNSVFRHAPARMKGADQGDYLSWIGPMVAKYSKIGEPLIRGLLKTAIGRKKKLRILEIGCGSAAYLNTAYQLNPAAEGVGMDVDGSVVEEARANLKRWGLDDRFTIIHGDITDPDSRPKGRFDLITLYNLIYYFEEDRRRDLLKLLRDQLADDGRLVVAANFQGYGRDLSAANLNLAVCSMKGCTPLPDLDEFKNMLVDCGYTIIQAKPLAPKTAFVGLIAR